MKTLLFIVLAVLTSMGGICQKISGDVTVIAFGSCSRQSNTDQMWDAVNRLKPHLWIWGGDNVYGDTHDMALLKTKYEQQKNHPGYQELLRNVPVTGTWDDHDYGINDGGKLYSKRKESKAMFLDFFAIGPNHPIRTHEGVYSTYNVGEGNRKIKIINLDTRTFRDTLMREYFQDPASGRSLYRNTQNISGTILGEDQWKWLSHELSTSDAAINIINSSIQVLPEEHRFEKWANFPAERKRLLELIVSSKASNVLIISGDRHIAEISETNLEALPYPLVDFTSSGLTHTWAAAQREENKFRQGDLVIERNFGALLIDWRKKEPSVTFQVRGKNGEIYQERKVTYQKFRRR